jgi:hypothetical protein
MMSRDTANEMKRGSLKAIGVRAARLAASRSGALLLSFVFTLLMVYNCVFPLGAIWSTDGIIEPDCGQWVWNLWVVNEAVTSGHNPYATSLIYYPVGAPNLSHQGMAAGFFPVTFLVKTLTGGAALYPLYAYRLIIWLCLSLLLYYSFRLLSELGCAPWAALTAAVSFSFSDFFMEHIAHLNILAGFFIPLAALCLLRCYRKPDSSANLLKAASVLACALYFTESILYVYLSALLFLLLPFADERRALLERCKRAGFRRLLQAAALFFLLSAPYLLLLLTDDFIKPPLGETATYSANLAGFFLPHPQRTPLYGALFASLVARIKTGVGGYEVFTSFLLLSFAIVGVLALKRRRVRIAAATALVFYLLSLGPTLKIFETDTGWPMPYALLMRLPPFDWGRTPSRFVLMGLFLLMIVAAQGLTWLSRELTVRRGERWSFVVMALLFAWATAEAYSPTPRQPSLTAPSGLERLAAGPVLNLPLMEADGYSAFLQTFHHRPIATGYLARASDARRAHYERLRRLLEKGGGQMCAELERMGFRNLVIAPRAYLARYAQRSAPLDLSQCGLNVVDLRQPDGVTAADDRSAEGILLSEPPGFPTLAPGRRLELAGADSEPFLWYGWSGREQFSRWTEQGRAAITFKLGEDKPAGLRVKMIPFLAPGRLDAQHVGVRLNGELLTTLVLTERESRVYSIALPHELLRERNVLSFELADAESPRQLGAGEDSRLLGINVEWIELETR